MQAQNTYTVREHMANAKVQFIQHPLAPKDVYVELKRDKDGKATHFITHYRNTDKEERIDDRSHYDKSNDSRWAVLTQDDVKKIIAAKAASNAKAPVAIAPVITPAKIVEEPTGIIEVAPRTSP